MIVSTEAIHVREKERNRIENCAVHLVHTHIVPLYSLIKVQLVSISYLGPAVIHVTSGIARYTVRDRTYRFCEAKVHQLKGRPCYSLINDNLIISSRSKIYTK